MIHSSRSVDTKTLLRRCLVCGKQIRVRIYPDGHYLNGQFFKKLKVPIGQGHYKEIGKTRFGKSRFKVVKWIGKEKEIEYWECNACYEQADHESWLEQTIEDLYGKRCKDYHSGCGACRAWDVCDTILELAAEEKKLKQSRTKAKSLN